MNNETKAVIDGVKLGNKEFLFRRLTVTNSAKMLKKLMPSFWGNVRNIIFRTHIKKRWWIKIRGLAFEKNFLWKWFGVVPRELRCNVIMGEKAEEIEESFFDYAPGIVREYERLLKSPNPSLTPNKKIKEGN